MNLKEVMRESTQPLFILQAADRAILASSVSCLSVEPQILTASIMRTEKNSVFLREKETPVTLWRLSTGFGKDRFLDRNFEKLRDQEYVWKAHGLLWPLVEYGDHEIVTIEQLEIIPGKARYELFWKNGRPAA